MLTTKTWLEPEPDWVPIRNAYSILRDRIADTLKICGLIISYESMRSPLGMIIRDGNSNEVIVNYNGTDKLLIECELNIYGSEMKHPFRQVCNWWNLQNEINAVFRERCTGCDISGIGQLIAALDFSIKSEFSEAPKNKNVRAFARVGSILSPFSFIASDVWDVTQVNFESNEANLKNWPKLYSIHFCPIDPAHTKEPRPVNSIVQSSCPLPSKPMPNEQIYSTGAPGRQTSKSLVLTEMQARINSARIEPVLKDEAEALAKWLCENHPSAPSMTVRTIENAIRDLHHRAKPQKEKQ
jgi:hypothetical protein